MPVASLLHLDRPTSQDSDNHKIRQVALDKQQITQEAASLANLLRHPLLLSARLSQPNLALAPAILVAASLAPNLEQVAASLDKTTPPQRLSKVVAFSVLQQEQIPASGPEVALGPDLAPQAVYLVATTNSSNSSRSRSHSVEQLLPLAVLGLAPLVSAPTIILRTPALVYLAILARPTLLLGKLSSSPLSQTHSAALGLKIRTSPITHHPSEGLVLSSNKSKSRPVFSADKTQILLEEVVCLD